MMESIKFSINIRGTTTHFIIIHQHNTLIISLQKHGDFWADLDKYFKKEAKKNRIPIEEASERFEKVLDTAIKIRFYRTYEFEALLKKAESDEEREEIFNKVRIE